MAKGKGGVTVKEVDRGFNAIARTLKLIAERKSYVKVGVIASGAPRDEGDPMDNVSLALIHEYGAPSVGVPARFWLRDSMATNANAHQALLARFANGIYAGKMGVQQALGLLGAKASTDVKKYITTGANLIPNAPSTIKGKGSSRPLVDTGKLVQGITWEVVMVGDKEGGK